MQIQRCHSLVPASRTSRGPRASLDWWAAEKRMSGTRIARLYLVRGRVQGVGFRYFVQREAERLDITGYTRNLDDGSVEVYAVGTAEQLSELAGLLHKGPRWADVRGVEEREEAVRNFSSFEIRH